MITIHGKQYVTVAERVTEAHKDQEKITILTELVPNGESIVFKATVTTSKGTFTGYSAANPKKLIEKESPYEVAETSAVGRALGFAGYGSVESIASGEEMVVATRNEKGGQAVTPSQALGEAFNPANGGDLAPDSLGVCKDCGAPNKMSVKGNLYCSKKCWLPENER